MKTTLFVVDNDIELSKPLDAIRFNDYLNDYLNDYPKLDEQKTRIINLCDTQRHLSQGYYCSLLAEARGHSVFPSLKVINALRSDDVYLWCTVCS